MTVLPLWLVVGLAAAAEDPLVVIGASTVIPELKNLQDATPMCPCRSDAKAVIAGITDDFFSTGFTIGSTFCSTCLGATDTSILGGGYVIEPSFTTVIPLITSSSILISI